jgi:hypothetical protein
VQSRVGDGAVVANDVESYTVVAGNPAKRVNLRVPRETADRLLSVVWWDWPDAVLKENAELFDHTFNRERVTEADDRVLTRFENVNT